MENKLAFPVECGGCKDIFYTTNKRKKYCSYLTCGPSAMASKKKSKEIDCMFCGKTIITSLKKQRFCSQKCGQLQRASLLINNGSKHPSSNKWKVLREYIFERDLYKCLECEDDKNLHVHHVKFIMNGGNNDESNLITLCQKCHVKKHYIINL